MQDWFPPQRGRQHMWRQLWGRLLPRQWYVSLVAKRTLQCLNSKILSATRQSRTCFRIYWSHLWDLHLTFSSDVRYVCYQLWILCQFPTISQHHKKTMDQNSNEWICSSLLNLSYFWSKQFIDIVKIAITICLVQMRFSSNSRVLVTGSSIISQLRS